MPPKFEIKGNVAGHLLENFLNHIRAFESQHTDEVHLIIASDARDMTDEELEEAIRNISPPFPFIKKMSR